VELQRQVVDRRAHERAEVLVGRQRVLVLVVVWVGSADQVVVGLAPRSGRGQPLGALAKVMTKYPQVLISIPGVDKSLVASSPELSRAVQDAETELGDSGRVLVRPSGTEPVVRVMVEAVDSGHAQQVAGALADTVRSLA
jgi:phosphoglucosamine mutase